MSEIRVGRIHNVDYNSGMVEVIYTDRGNTITSFIPILSMNNEYIMPDIGSMVLVVHLSNGNTAGIVLGTFFNEINKPVSTGKGVYHKEFSNTIGSSYIHFEDDKLVIYAKDIVLKNDEKEVSINEL